MSRDESAAATTEARAAVIREIFWQPLRIADHDKANAALDSLLAELADALHGRELARLDTKCEQDANQRLHEALSYYAEGRYWDNGDIARDALRHG